MNLQTAFKILKNNNIKLIKESFKAEDELDEIFSECIEDYEYDLPFDDATYNILRWVKRNYRTELKPQMMKMRDSGNKKWKYNCYNLVSDYIDSEAERRGY